MGTIGKQELVFLVYDDVTYSENFVRGEGRVLKTIFGYQRISQRAV